MRQILLALALLSILGACRKSEAPVDPVPAPVATTVADADATFADLSRRALDGWLQLSPVAATQIGAVVDLPTRRPDSMLASAPQAVPPAEVAKLKGPTPAVANTPLTNPMLASVKQRQ